MITHHATCEKWEGIENLMLVEPLKSSIIHIPIPLRELTTNLYLTGLKVRFYILIQTERSLISTG
jgi:hypothetical protein